MFGPTCGQTFENAVSWMTPVLLTNRGWRAWKRRLPNLEIDLRIVPVGGVVYGIPRKEVTPFVAFVNPKYEKIFERETSIMAITQSHNRTSVATVDSRG